MSRSLQRSAVLSLAIAGVLGVARAEPPAPQAGTDVGHLGIGARADLIMLDAPSHVYLAYRPGVPLVAGVWQAGQLVAGHSPMG